MSKKKKKKNQTPISALYRPVALNRFVAQNRLNEPLKWILLAELTPLNLIIFWKWWTEWDKVTVYSAPLLGPIKNTTLKQLNINMEQRNKHLKYIIHCFYVHLNFLTWD